MKSPHVVKQKSLISPADREARHDHRGMVIWLTGFSGAGKSTLAHLAEAHLFHAGKQVYVLDGDNIRHGLCGDLGFSAEDRAENIRRIAEVAHLFCQAGWIVLCAFISPRITDRQLARRIIGEQQFKEVFIDCPLSVCEARDVKGIYAKARRGEIDAFTGISAPYEPPPHPDLHLAAGEETVAQSLQRLLALIDESTHR